jgi:hypothetical protein
MNENSRDDLDEALAQLPRDAETSRDLWPEIRATIKAEARQVKRGNAFGMWGQLAAGFVLVAMSSVGTYVLTRHSVQSDAQAMVANVITASFDDATLGPDYRRARADLDRLFAERMASFPPAMRAKLQSNLADLRRASDEIAMTLAQHPSDPLLQELLVSTRRRELQLMADISRMQIPNS